MSFPHRRHAERNSVETPHFKTCLIFRSHLRPHFWLSRGGPFFSMCALGERQRHHCDFCTGTHGHRSQFRWHRSPHRSPREGCSSGWWCLYPLFSLTYLHADGCAARDHGHGHWIIHTPARQAERVRAPRKTGVWQSIAPPHSLRARSMYPGKQRRRFDRL